MYLIYGISLILLVAILILLFKEEGKFKKSITHGLAHKYWVLRERRRYIRFNDQIKIRYNIVQNNSSNPTSSRTVNLSKEGLCLLTYEKLKEKSYLDLEIEIPNFSKPVRLIGQVLWIKDLQTQDVQGRRLFYVGVKFSKIKAEDEARLLTHLNTLKYSQREANPIQIS